MKNNWEDNSYSDSTENTTEERKTERNIENAEEESFIRNWFHELKVDVKKVFVIIIALVFIIGYREARKEVVSDVFLDPVFDKLDTTDEFLSEAEKQQQFEEDWRSYREQERAKGGPTYRVEDAFAETLKPDHWRNFLVFPSVPENFYYKDYAIESKDPGDWTVTQMYHEMNAEQNFFFYTQSRDKEYNKANLPEGIEKKEGQLFTEVKDSRNVVYWFYDDLTLYLEGNIPMEELERLANEAINYDELYYDYSAMEDLEQ